MTIVLISIASGFVAGSVGGLLAARALLKRMMKGIGS